MVEVAKVTVEASENPPPNPVSVSSTESPQAEASIAAAIQTGAAAERAEQAAAKAEETQSEAARLLAEIRKSLQPELEQISERLAALETMEEEELEEMELEEPEKNGTSDSRGNVAVVSLPEPRVEKPKQGPKPEGKRASGLFHRLFLNK